MEDRLRLFVVAVLNTNGDDEWVDRYIENDFWLEFPVSRVGEILDKYQKLLEMEKEDAKDSISD